MLAALLLASSGGLKPLVAQAGGGEEAGWPDDALTRRALELHADAYVVDGHNDLPWRYRGIWGLDPARGDLGGPRADGHTDMVRLRRGGVDLQWWAAYVPVRFRGAEATRVAREQIGLTRALIDRYDDLAFAGSLAEVRAAEAEGRIASMIGVEGGHAIDGSLEVLRELYADGARYLTLTHSASLAWADAAGDTPIAGGLSGFGREVIGEMNRLGMLVDISHVTDATMHDVLDATRAPVIFSHSSARSLADHPRNVPDDVLERLPRNGGVVMVNFFSGFLTEGGARAVQHLFQEEARIRRENPEPGAFARAMQAWYDERVSERGSVATIVDHIDHIVEVAGIDHVGLGSDFDGVPMLPDGMEDVSRLPAITRELLVRGYSDDDVRKILGENFLRAFEVVEEVAGLRPATPGP